MQYNYEERRLINEMNDAANKAKKFETEARELKARLDKVQKENSYAVQSKIPGTPEWQRESMLQQERQVQADRAYEAMFKHGIQELFKHISANGSIYGLKVNDWRVVHQLGQSTITINVKPHK